MSYRVQFTQLAESELQKSFDWYEERQIGVGERFLHAVGSSLTLISSNPEMYPKKIKNLRQTVVEDFPFVIIYECLKKERMVSVLHVFHTSRNPRRKHRRR